MFEQYIEYNLLYYVQAVKAVTVHVFKLIILKCTETSVETKHLSVSLEQKVGVSTCHLQNAVIFTCFNAPEAG